MNISLVLHFTYLCICISPAVMSVSGEWDLFNCYGQNRAEKSQTWTACLFPALLALPTPPQPPIPRHLASLGVEIADLSAKKPVCRQQTYKLMLKVEVFQFQNHRLQKTNLMFLPSILSCPCKSIEQYHVLHKTATWLWLPCMLQISSIHLAHCCTQWLVL